MRSQKKNNRAPRPFKNKQQDRGWSGGRSDQNVFFTPRSFLLKPKLRTAPEHRDEPPPPASAEVPEGNEP